MKKVSQTQKNIFILLLVVLSFFAITRTLAIMDPYEPGATNDPDCSPGDAFCTVRVGLRLFKESPNGVTENVATGTNSIVVGSGATASGNYSIAIGHEDGDNSEDGPNASGNYSVAIGNGATASGSFSTALRGAMANGVGSFAAVYGVANGAESVSIGRGTSAASFREISLGSYPLAPAPQSATSWNASDPIFVVGNGTNSGARSNALTIFKDGNIKVGGTAISTNYNLDMASKTSGIMLPKGTTAQRPGDRPTDPVSDGRGVIRYNTDTGRVEASIASGASTAWSSLGFNNIKEQGLTSTAEFGAQSIAIGEGVAPYSPNMVALGMFSRLADMVGDHGLLVVGNGTDASRRSNALLIHKDGTIGLGDVAASELIAAKGLDIFLTTDTGAYLTVDGTWTDASDQSLKTNITNLSYGLEAVKNLRPRSFNFIRSGKQGVGFIAQEVEGIIPEVVSQGATGTKGIEYGQLTAVLTKAIQELEARVATLEQSSGVYVAPPPPPEENEPEENEPEEEIPPVEDDEPQESQTTSPTEEGEQQASLILSSNEFNLTNILLMIAVGLLFINLIAVLAREHKKS